MRLLRISFVAVIAMTILPGCTGSRSRLGLSRDRETIAPEVHEYSPRAGEPGNDDFRNPSGEPAPAPPAVGISRVKSVSFLRHIGSKLHGNKDNCSSGCVDDNELVGECSPIEPCVPREQHNHRVHRYIDRYYCSENTNRLNPLRSFQKSVHRLFHGKPVADCSSECGTHLESSCSMPEKVCDQSHRARRVCEDPCGVEVTRPAAPSIHPKRSSDSLAEPMEESDISGDPGLITPKPETSEPGMPNQSVPAVPQTNQPAVPPAPQAGNSAPAATHPVENLPLPPGTTKTVEPPVWPRLQSSNKQVSYPAMRGMQPSTGNPMIIQPRPGR